MGTRVRDESAIDYFDPGVLPPKWSDTSRRCNDPDCDSEECITPCACGRGANYPRCRFRSCYQCFLDRASDYISCVLCGRWHSPGFDTCFKCKPETRGRDDAAKALRQLILHRDEYRCQTCGVTSGDIQPDPLAYDKDAVRSATLQVDHIVPCRHGGTADEWNLQVLCGLCNRIKLDNWHAGCKYEAVKTNLCNRYLLIAGSYFDPEERARFIADVRLHRVTGTWDPGTHKLYTTAATTRQEADR